MSVAAPSCVFAIGRVAKMLDEDEAWLQRLAMEMEPEDGRLGIWETDEDTATTAFTSVGVEYLKELVKLYRDQRPPRSRR